MVVSTNQLWSSCKDGVRRSLSGRKSISFIIFASLTGNSWRRNTKEVFSQALADPARHRTHSNFDKHFYHTALPLNLWVILATKFKGNTFFNDV